MHRRRKKNSKKNATTIEHCAQNISHKNALSSLFNTIDCDLIHNSNDSGNAQHSLNESASCMCVCVSNRLFICKVHILLLSSVTTRGKREKKPTVDHCGNRTSNVIGARPYTTIHQQSFQSSHLSTIFLKCQRRAATR